MGREDSADEGEHRAPDGGVEGPAQRAVSGFVGRRVVSAVAYGLLTAPASGVEYQAQDEEEACRQKREQMKTPWRVSGGVPVCWLLDVPALGSGLR